MIDTRSPSQAGASPYMDISLDLETLGTDPGSVITQIGVCAFDRGSGAIGPATNFYVDPQSCLDIGMTVSWSTIRWWMTETSEEARRAFVRDGFQISDALRGLREWINTNACLRPRIWGHGACFDVVLLEAAYRKVGLNVPWHFRDIRDLRTLAELGPKITRPPATVEHIAMDDAIAQAQWIAEAYRQILPAAFA